MSEAAVVTERRSHPPLSALTGGPCGGKLTLLRRLARFLCEHVATVSEVATLLFANGFPYRTSDVDRRAAQRAIFVVRREYEEIVRRTEGVRAVLCDRGTLDGLAYWPGTDEEYRAEVGSSRDEELARYTAVIHLRPWMPARREGDLSRREPPAHTPLIEERLLAVWQAPRRRVLEATPDFEQKARDLTTELTELLPPTCFASGE